MQEGVKKRGAGYWLKLAAAAGIAGLVLYFQGAIYLLARPARAAVCCLTPADSGFAYEDVTLTASDGVSLAGWYIPSQNGAAVILLHGYGGSRLGTWFQAQTLAAAGYASYCMMPAPVERAVGIGVLLAGRKLGTCRQRLPFCKPAQK